MDPPYVHAFVVKLWLERREIEGAEPEWRGRIDHVQSGKRLYFRDIVSISQFIQTFLGDVIGLEPGEEQIPDPTTHTEPAALTDESEMA